MGQSPPLEKGLILRYVLVVDRISEVSLAWTHTVASQRAQLFQGMQTFASSVLFVVVVENVAELVTLHIFVEHVGLLHNGVTDRDVRVCKWNVEHVLAYAPEVYGLLKSFHKREILPL